MSFEQKATWLPDLIVNLKTRYDLLEKNNHPPQNPLIGLISSYVGFILV
jgi:hypothetical protein